MYTFFTPAERMRFQQTKRTPTLKKKNTDNLTREFSLGNQDLFSILSQKVSKIIFLRLLYGIYLFNEQYRFNYVNRQPPVVSGYQLKP